MIKRIGILVTLFTVFAPLGIAQFKKTPVEVEIQVVDEVGVPIPSIEVKISYMTLLDSEKAVRESKLSDEEGRVRFRGNGYKRVSVYVEQSGYYGYRDYLRIEDLPESPEIRVVLKKVRNPIVMLATKRFRHVVPAGTRVGFDFFRNDLVEPHGKGEHADVFFSISGEFEDRKNHDSLLSIEFANEGDGLVSFGMDYSQGSILESGHVAPPEGYQREKRTRKMAKEITGLDPERPGYVKYESLDEVDEGIGHYIRIRTVLDENGEIVSAYYGKVYGDFDFFGAHPDGSFVRADAYYINPTPNDRNVEAVPGESLLEGIDRLDQPNWP